VAVNESALVTEMRTASPIFQTPPTGGEVKRGPGKVRIDSKVFFNLQFFTLDLPEDLQEHLAVVEVGPAHSSMLKIPWAVYVLPKYKGLSILTPDDLTEIGAIKTRAQCDEFFEKLGGMRLDLV